MKLIAAGRASEIFDLGDGRVLRRFRAGGDPEREALVMRHARANGYPVPRVLEVAADSLVLERIDGPTMLADLWRRPWKLRDQLERWPTSTSACMRSKHPSICLPPGRAIACSTSTCIRRTSSSRRPGRSSSTGRMHGAAIRRSTWR
jgi:hypothetical protein